MKTTEEAKEEGQEVVAYKFRYQCVEGFKNKVVKTEKMIDISINQYGLLVTFKEEGIVQSRISESVVQIKG